jgi:hypothetical protein
MEKLPRMIFVWTLILQVCISSRNLDTLIAIGNNLSGCELNGSRLEKSKFRFFISHNILEPVRTPSL